MVLTRSSALAAALALAALPACKQSLFDEHGEADAGPVIGSDGGSDAPDVGADGGADAPGEPADARLWDGPPAPDGPPSELCPEPCVGDAVRDFADTQGGTNGRWLYLEDLRAVNGADYADLVWGAWSSLAGWVKSASPPPALLSCTTHETATDCSGVPDTVLFVPTTTAASNTDPALAFVSPLDGRYRVSASYRTADFGAVSAGEKIFVSRNTRHDLIAKKTFSPSTTVGTLTADIDALAGDRILLSLAPGAAGAVSPVAFDVFVTDLEDFPGDCLLALTFDDLGAPVDACTGNTWLDENYSGGALSVATDPPAPHMGKARRFVEDQYVRSTGPALNLSGDFTIQFWAKLEGSPWTTEALFSNWDCYSEGGVSIWRYYGTVGVSFFWENPLVEDWCFSGPPAGNMETTAPGDGGWHFYRVSRSASDGDIKFCIDGVLKGTSTAAGSADMTSAELPSIARNVTYNPPYFNGVIDDFRVYRAALPCPTAP